MQHGSTQDNEITAKIVYYGPGLSGKTTCFQYLYKALPVQSKGKLLSLATNIDRTIYFDFLPLKLDRVQGLNLRMQLYTVPGQVRFNATRKMVLKDVDAIVFVADMQRTMLKANQDSLNNLAENLRDYHQELASIPHALQYNKEDLPNLLTTEELNDAINVHGAPAFVTCALTGKGVMEALKAVTRLLITDIKKRRDKGASPATISTATPPAGSRVRPASAPRARRTESQAVARRLLQARIGEGRVPSTETLERHIREGGIEDVASGARWKTATEAEPPSPPAGADVNATQSVASLTPAPRAEPRAVSDTSRAAVVRPKNACSMAPLFGDATLRRAYQDLESMTQTGGAALARTSFGSKALVLLDGILKDEDLFPEKDGPVAPATRMNLLGVRYGRYLRFQGLLARGGSEPLGRDDALVCLHFLVDVALAKGEVGR